MNTPLSSENSANKSPRILVIRPDRLGDVILSTPVLIAIKRHYSHSHLTFLVKENVTPLLKGLPQIDAVLIYDPEGRHAGLKGFFRFCHEIRKGHFDISITLQSQWKITLALFLARIPVRVGPLSKIHSYLFTNRGLRQRRSQVEMHEADYNLQLLEKLGIKTSSRISTQVALSPSTHQAAREWLQQQGWTSNGKKWVFIHPGMGGSALNWPETYYIELIKGLLNKGCGVVVTAGSGEADLSRRMSEGVLAGLATSKQNPGATSTRKGAVDGLLFYRASSEQGVDFLAGLFSHADLVVAPSTGPLHVAVALDKPVLSFYPAIRVQSPKRWGPYRSDVARTTVLVPTAECGKEYTCLGKDCPHHPCMESISVEQALAKAIELLT